MRVMGTTRDECALRDKGIRLRAGLAMACVLALPASALAAAHGAADGVRLAYVDPGSGSFILQALVATAAGAAVAINAYWGKIKKLLGLGASPADDETADSQSHDD